MSPTRSHAAVEVPDIGPQPAPVVVMAPVSELPNPARLLLGMTAPAPAGLLADGWWWRAYRSVGFTRKAKRLDDPERWVAIEVVTLRLAGPPLESSAGASPPLESSAGAGPSRARVVCVWERDVVTLAKAKRRKDGTRPEKTAAWSSEGWAWIEGQPGDIPRAVSIEDIKPLIRREIDMPPRTRKAAAPAAPTLDGADEARDSVAREALDQLAAAPQHVDILRALLDDMHARLSAFEQLSGTTDPDTLVHGVDLDGVPPALDVARRELDGIVERTGHPALAVVLARLDTLEKWGEPGSPAAPGDSNYVVENPGLTARYIEAHPGIAPGCVQCAELLDLDMPGHHCETCRDVGGEHTPVPHGYTLCPSHLADAIERADQGAQPGETATANGVLDALTAAGAYVPVPKRWRDIVASDIFVGRSGDLWVVKEPLGERDEFTKGKGTVRVAQGTKVYARDFDPDETANVLVPAAVSSAHQVLVDVLGAGLLLGAEQVPA